MKRSAAIATQPALVASDKDVTVIGGADTLRQCPRAGLADELHIDIGPVLLRGGLRPCDAIAAEPIRLKRLQAAELPAGRTHLRFRIVK